MIVKLSKDAMKQYIKQLIEIDDHICNNMGHIYSTEIWKSENFLCDREGKWNYSLLSLNDGSADGCAIVTEYKRGFLHINRFFVDPERSGRGIGGQLISGLKDYLKRGDIEEVNLFVSTLNKKHVTYLLILLILKDFRVL